jgi:hypothetical protein
MCAKRVLAEAPAQSVAQSAMPPPTLRRQLSEEGKKMFLDANDQQIATDAMDTGEPLPVETTTTTTKKKKKKKKKKFGDLMASMTAPSRTISQERRDHQDNLKKMTGGGTFQKIDKI